MKRSPHLVMLGHLNIDVLTRTKEIYGHSQPFSLANIKLEFGGSIAHMGRASAKFGVPRTAICCVGEDISAGLLEDFLRGNYEQFIVRRKSCESSSVVSIVYKEGGREVYGPYGSPNDRLSIEDIADPVVADALSRADVLFVDGYFAIRAAGRRACHDAISRASSAGAWTVVDIVPHDSNKLYGADELQSLVSQASIVVIEAKTISGFFSLSKNTGIDEIVGVFKARFPDLWGIIRYGDHEISLSRIVNGSREIDIVQHSTEGASVYRTAGYGDYLLISQILTLWNHPEEMGIPRSSLPPCK